MRQHRIFSPLTWPVYSFLAVILLGACALRLPASLMPGQSLPWIDAFFIATSAVCVTGLSTVDVSSVLSPIGQGILLFLIQTGGLGVMTYTSLIFLLWRRAVPFTSREAVSQALLGDTFDLRRFIREVVAITAGIELLTAVLLYCCDPAFFTPFKALFHAVSAFCNAGFALKPDNLMSYREHAGVNAVICMAVILGGLGFTVLRETLGILTRGRVGAETARYSRFSRLVLKTSFMLIVAGAVLLFLIEWRRPGNELSVGEGLSLGMAAVFHSVIARTAGFNTIDMTACSEASLLILCVLMFIGGSSGSCAGGIKVVTFRVLVGYIVAQCRNERQVVLEGRGVPSENLTRALTIFFLYCLLIMTSTLLLSLSESGILDRSGGGDVPLLRLLFEVVSALGTVGLSLNFTSELTDFGKGIIIANMFAGRVGLLALIMAVRSLQRSRRYDYAEAQLPIG